MNKRSVVSNLIVAMFAQGISLILSFLISFIVPKVLNVESFSYWQLFIFYIAYVGFFHFGINDGVYLKYGGKDIDKMNKKLISGQFKVLVLIQIVIIFVVGSITFSLNIESERKWVLIFVLMYMIISNLSSYLAYIFQAANLTKWYSYSVILDKIFFIISLVVLLLIKNDNFKIYIGMYVCGKVLCFIYCIIKGRGLIFNKVSNYTEVLLELEDSFKIGIKLTLSSMSNMLILGVGRFMIDSFWGITVFGKISFALSLTTFLLAFIQQVSMVFFPMLRRIDESMQKKIYILMRQFCFFVMPIVYLLMVPGKLFIESWVPQYAESVFYLGIMLPICIFDAKMNMIFNTFFKTLRKEKELLKINALTMIISCVLAFLGTYIFKSYWIVIFSMVIVVAFRSTISEMSINKKYEMNTFSTMVYELMFAFVYVVMSIKIKNYYIVAMGIVLVYVIQIIMYKKDFITFIRKIRILILKKDNR